MTRRYENPSWNQGPADLSDFDDLTVRDMEADEDERHDCYPPELPAEERIDAASGTHEEILAGEHGDRGNPPGVHDFYRWTAR